LDPAIHPPLDPVGCSLADFSGGQQFHAIAAMSNEAPSGGTPA
jgi:hypothetical protein